MWQRGRAEGKCIVKSSAACVKVGHCIELKMAARRVSKSSLDWAAFAKKIPENQKTSFNAFKAKQDEHVRRIAALPENLPKIDWNAYKGRVANGERQNLIIIGIKIHLNLNFSHAWWLPKEVRGLERALP